MDVANQNLLDLESLANMTGYEQGGSVLVCDKLYKDHHKVWDELDIIEKNICENTCIKYSKEIVLMWERELKNHFLEEERDFFPTIKNADNELAIHLLIEEHKIILSLIERIKTKNKKSDIIAFCSYMKMHIKGEEELMNKFFPDPYKKGGDVSLAPKNQRGYKSNATGVPVKPANQKFHLPDRICEDGSVHKICIGHGGTVAKGW